jgi:hypothetical protein
VIPPAHRYRHDGTQGARVLRTLAALPSGEALTTDLIFITEKPGRWSDPAVVRQRALARVGNELRGLVTAGLVIRSGKTTDTGWQKCPTHRWRITFEGRKLIAWWDDKARRDAILGEQGKARAARRAARAEALAIAKTTYGPGMSRTERQHGAKEMRAAGCVLREIATVFGVTPECIRLDLLSPPYGIYTPPSHRGKTTSGKMGRWPLWLHNLEYASPYAGLVKVTFTEW